MLILRLKYWRLLLLTPFLATLLFYFQTTEFGYVWDDKYILLETSGLRSWASIWSHVGKAFLGGQVYFRPLALFSLGMDQIMGGGSAFASHLVAVVLFGFNTVLVALLGGVVAHWHGRQPRGALIAGVGAGLFYALHPALIEVVSWISCRFDLLLCFFCLLMLLADRLATGWTRVVTVGICWFLAALSKETALGAALALPFWHLHFSRPAGWRDTLREFHASRNFHIYGLIFCFGLVYLWLRHLGSPDFYEAPMLSYKPLSAQHLLCVLKSIGGYARFAAWPFLGIGPVHALFIPLSPLDPLILLGLSGTLLMAALLIKTLRGWRGPATLLLPLCASLMPTINLIPLQIGGSFIHERFLAFPLIFLALMVPVLSMQLWRALKPVSPALRKTLASVLILAWGGLCAMNLEAGIPFWRDNLSLWTLGYMREPDSLLAQSNLQAAYVNGGLYQQAKQFTEDLVKRGHKLLMFDQVENYVWALTGLNLPRTATVQALADKIDETGGSPRELAPMYANCAWLLMLDGDTVRSKSFLERALAIDPQLPDANYRYGVLYLVQDQPQQARPYLDSWRRNAHPSEIVDRESRIPGLIQRIKRLRDKGGSTAAAGSAPDAALDLKSYLPPHTAAAPASASAR